MPSIAYELQVNILFLFNVKSPLKKIAVCLYKNITFDNFDPFKWNYLLNTENANASKIWPPLKYASLYGNPRAYHAKLA